MKKSLTLLLTFCLLLCFNARADRFIYKGDTSYVNINSPLEQYPDIDDLRKQLIGFESMPCFDCPGRTYEAEWTVIDHNLYLTAIYSDENAISKLKADINKLFHTHQGKVRADWVTQDIWVPVGKPIRWRDITQPIYGKEYKFTIMHGEIKEVKEFNYPTEKMLWNDTHPEILGSFIYSKINWNKLPDLNGKTIKVVLTFTTGASGRPENIKVRRPLDVQVYSDEAIRVMGLLPWSADYWHGAIRPQSWAYPVIFSEENRKKYTH
jgi:hypothetical protein